MATETEKAWAAGFFDGEGSTSITRYTPKNQHKQSTVLTVSIKQVHPEVLERFKAAVGGEGVINGPYQRNDHQPYWMYRASGVDRVQGIINAIWPYLGSVKRDQAQRAIDTAKGEYRKPGAPTKEFCKRGHDLGVWGTVDRGRKGHNRCRECERLQSLAGHYRRTGRADIAEQVMNGSHDIKRYRRAA